MPNAPDNKFWFPQDGGAFYLIPEGTELLEGDFDLRTLTGERAMVDREAIEPYKVDKATAHAHLKGELRAGLRRFGKGLSEAWQQGRNRGRKPRPTSGGGRGS